MWLIPLTAAAQKGIALSLTINNEVNDTIYADEPVLFSVTLTNRAAQEAALWNLANNRRVAELQRMLEKKQISPEQFAAEKLILDSVRRKITPLTAGSREKPWYTELEWYAVNAATQAPVSFTPVLLPKPAAEAVALLDENGYYKVVFGFSAALIQKMTAGNLSVVVKLRDVKSLPVQMVLTGAPMPKQLAESEEAWLHTGSYYWHAGDAALTMAYADKVLERNPVSLEGLVLKGDGQVLQKSYLPALETYNKALKEYYRQYGSGEPPEYLLSVIDLVKKELGQ
jgi:tetratricopeptide (TPR) repeat protein